MQYPNVGAPSPEEIYRSLSMIPNSPEGKQKLGQLAAQGKQSGGIEGGIATAILNSYNQSDQAKQAPPAPQGSVVDHVLAQSQPPAPQFDPSMAGIAAPGLEKMAQQQAAQRMATGGIVALAHGGPVRTFADGGLSDAWGAGMPDVPEAPDTTPYQLDLLRPPATPPSDTSLTAPPTTTTRPVHSGESHNASYEERLQHMETLYGVPPDVAAELLSKHEYNNAQRSKMNTFENIAAGLAGYLGTYGSGQHRVGAGIASMLGTMGEHRRDEDKEEATLDAYRAKSMTLPYEQRKNILDQLIASDTATGKEHRAAMLEMAKLGFGRDTEAMKKQYDITEREMASESAENVARIQAEAHTRAAMLKNAGINPAQIKGSDLAGVLKTMIGSGVYTDKEVMAAFPEYANILRQEVGGTGGSRPFPQLGTPITLSSGHTGFLSDDEE